MISGVYKAINTRIKATCAQPKLTIVFIGVDFVNSQKPIAAINRMPRKTHASNNVQNLHCRVTC